MADLEFRKNEDGMRGCDCCATENIKTAVVYKGKDEVLLCEICWVTEIGNTFLNRSAGAVQILTPQMFAQGLNLLIKKVESKNA